MARLARAVAPGFPHHVTQRGNRKMPVFRDDYDRKAYLALLSQRARRYGLDIWAYCLMDNHIHLVVVPQHRSSIALTLRDTHTLYARRFNDRHDECGHLWQGRYYSCILDEAHLWTALKYVENNPVRAGLAARAEDFAWSSAQGHCGLRKDGVLSPRGPLSDDITDWAAWLAEEDPPAGIDALRHRTRTGRPCGDDGFVHQLEESLGRLLRLKRRGPKRRKSVPAPLPPI